MEYLLAKELKDAGFPQQMGELYVLPGGSLVGGSYQGEDQTSGCRVPTLSELIGACGDRFEELGYLGKDEAERFRWYTTDRHGVDYMRYYGSTPEEAVARLWLALNVNKEHFASNDTTAVQSSP